MENKEYRKFRKDIKPYLTVLDAVKKAQYYPVSTPVETWLALIDLHYKWVKKGKGSKECEGCKKYFKVCNELNSLRRD